MDTEGDPVPRTGRGRGGARVALGGAGVERISAAADRPKGVTMDKKWIRSAYVRGVLAAAALASLAAVLGDYVIWGD